MINIMYAVDPIKRIVKPMSGHAVTEQDHEASSLRFAFPDNIAGTGLDSTGAAVRVMYIRPDGGDPVAKTLTFYKHSGGYYLYDWNLQKSDLQKEGRLVFSLCILNIVEGDVEEWHTTPCAVRVLSTIHTDDSDEGDDTITPTVRERVAVLETMIQRVASGAPIVVSSAAAMTDTSRIYVLTTDSKWYYYDGSAWVAGGEYGGVAAGSITTDKLADGAVTTAKIADGAITTAKIANGAVTGAKVGTGALTGDNIANKAIGTTKIDDSAVTWQKLAPQAVHTTEIADGAVTSAKLGDVSVTTAKIANGAITKEKLSNDITFETDKTLSVADVAADAKVTGNKIDILDNAVFTVSETPLYFDSKDSGGRIKANGSWEAASGYEVAKYEVSEGEYVKIIAHARFQFQTVTRLPSGTNPNIVGGTHDAGEYILEVPSTAKFLLLAKEIEDTSVGAYPVAVSKKDADAVKSIFLASENGKLAYFTIDNEYVTTGGIITHHALRKRSDYIPVKQLSHITMSIGIKSTYNCFYDAEKNFINSFAIEVEPTEIVVPQNAEYMIVSADKENFDTISGTVTYKYDREWVKPIGDRCGIYTAEASDVFDFEEGWIINGANVSNRGAVRTKACVTLPYDIILLPTGTNQIHYAVWMYASDNTTVIANSGVIYVPYVIPAGSNFRLAVGHFSGTEKPYLKNKNELLKYLFVADSYYSLTHIFDASLKDNPNGIHKMPFLEESHRGIGSTSLPDNTYWAIVNSAKYGLGAIEIDIRTTSDNVIVLWHNATVSGKIDGQDTTLTIANETYSTLSQLVLSTHWAYGDIKICTFDDALNLIWKYGLYVNLDCKDISPTAVASKIISNNLSGKAFYFNVGADIVNIIPEILAVDNKAKIGTVYHAQTLENIKNSGVDMRKIIVWQYEADVTADTYANIKSYGCDFLLADVDKNSIQKAMIYHPDIVEYNSMSANAIREAQSVFRNL